MAIRLQGRDSEAQDTTFPGLRRSTDHETAAFRGTAALVQRASGWGETKLALSQASASQVQLQLMPQAMGQARYLETTDMQSPDPHCTLQLELSSFSEISRGQCLGLGWRGRGEVAGSEAGPSLNNSFNNRTVPLIFTDPHRAKLDATPRCCHCCPGEGCAEETTLLLEHFVKGSTLFKLQPKEPMGSAVLTCLDGASQGDHSPWCS